MSVDMRPDLNTKDGKPAYVEFSTAAKHLPKQSQEQGRYVAIDEDRVTVRQIGSNDSVVFKVETWLAQNKVDVAQGRLNPAHASRYEEAYTRWKQGQELPVQGTPIKTWPVISPAQVTSLLAIHVRTVEDLASLNDEGLRRLGMGAIDLKQKAQAWLAQAQDKGPLTMEVAALKKENEALKLSLDSLNERLNALQKQAPNYHEVQQPADITADDILDTPQAGKRKR